MDDKEHDTYDLAGLCEAADVTVRTVRYYIQQGLLPGPSARGPNARYGTGHLDRLRLIRRLQAEDAPLAKIRLMLEELDDQAVRHMLAAGEPRSRTSALDYIHALRGGAMLLSEPAQAWSRPAPHAPAAPDQRAATSRSQWERIVLLPDVELHVRRPLTRQHHRKVDKLIELARDLFDEEA